MEIRNKVVWVTGASSGIGEALAYEFAREGAKVIISSRNEVRLNEVKDRCGAGDNVKVLPMDLSDAESIAAKAEEGISLFGSVDVLVNNAGLSQRCTAEAGRMDVARKIMEVNFFGTVALTKAILPHMLSRGSGSIATITSVLGKLGAPNRSFYCASKHALHGFFDSLRCEVGASGINVMLVCPGLIRTNVSVNALKPDGEPHGKMDKGQEKGMDPLVCARKIIRGLKREKDEILVGGIEIGGVWLKRFAPAILNWAVKKVKMT